MKHPCPEHGGIENAGEQASEQLNDVHVQGLELKVAATELQLIFLFLDEQCELERATQTAPFTVRSRFRE